MTSWLGRYRLKAARRTMPRRATPRKGAINAVIEQ
jgi:hypothetical protein